MANSLISMIKGGNTLINNTEVLNGQVLFNTDEKSILLDDNNTRSEYCGADKSNKNLAPIENGATASKGYSAGSYVVWKGQLYKVTRQINSGTAFSVGYNITADTVGAELSNHASSISTLTTAVNNKGKLVTLWTNPNPASQFGGQVVTLSEKATNYSLILVTFAIEPTPGVTSGFEVECIMRKSPDSTKMEAITSFAVNTGGLLFRRMAYFDTANDFIHLTFDGGSYFVPWEATTHTWTPYANALVPESVHGII